MNAVLIVFTLYLFGIFKVIYSVRNTACSYRTLNGHCCRLPFFYKNTKHKSCTNLGDASHRFWCPTDITYNKDKPNAGWGYCRLKQSQCLIRTIDGDCCSFPFKYRGKVHATCIAEGLTDQRYWCATSRDFNKTAHLSGWGYCAGITCYTCRNIESWDLCNNNTATRTCPYEFKHCVSFRKEDPTGFSQSSNDSSITKLFMKDCGLDWDCSEHMRKNRCDVVTHTNSSCYYQCCHGNLCNASKGIKGVAYRTFVLTSVITLGIQLICL